MKKNTNKIIAIGIVLSIITLGMVPAFASETALKPVLTLDTAINAAVGNSDKLALESTQITMLNNKIKLQDAIDDFYDSIGQTVYDFPYDKLELQKEQTAQSKDFVRDQIANDITNKYNAIILKEIDINKSKTNLEIKSKDFSAMKTKVTIGMATSNQLDDKQIEIASLQSDIKAKENSLQNDIDYFNVITNLDLSKYTLDQTIDYKLFAINGSVDEYLGSRIDEYLTYNDQMIDLTKDYFHDLRDDGIKDILDADIPTAPDKNQYIQNDAAGNTVGFNSAAYALALLDYQQKAQEHLTLLNAYGSYLDSKYSVDEATVKLADTRKSLLNGLKESYAALLDLQNKIDLLNDQIKSTNTKLKYAKSQVDLGLITENTYQAQVLKSEDLDTQLRSLINSYNSLKNGIQKPWILGNN